MGRIPSRPVKARGPPHGHNGRRIKSSNIGSTPHLIGCDPGRPVKTHWLPHESGGEDHIKPTSHRPRPSPAHPLSSGCAAIRPSQSQSPMLTAQPGPADKVFKSLGPARPIRCSKLSVRPGPCHQIFKILDPARHGRDKRPITSAV